jgi:phosphatidate cytidylyltransferase
LNRESLTSELKVRFVTAVILLALTSPPLFIATLSDAGWSKIYILGFGSLTILLAFFEYFSFAKFSLRNSAQIFLGLGPAVGVLSLGVFIKELNFTLAFGLGFLSLVVVTVLHSLERFFTANDRDLLITFILFSVGGGALVGLLFLPKLIVFLLSVVALIDVGAYFIGKNFGRLPLAKNISPKKTVEGALGGAILAPIGGILFYLFVSDLGSMTLVELYFIGFAVAVFGQIGDLLKSSLKRKYGVKDSSNLLPGHGGFLDRIDGLLGGAPVLYLFAFKF